jgi:hypothetical protein
MKILHILRSEPSQLVNSLIESSAGKDESEQYILYKQEINYAELIEKIFTADRVISWW